MVAAIHKIVQGDILVKGVLSFEDDKIRGRHCVMFSISISVLHQVSWKFCLYLYSVFIGLLPEYHLFHPIVVHVLH
jgi:hypothetical protein